MLDEAIFQVENKITHRNQTLSILASCAARQAAIANLLKPIRIDSLEIIVHQDFKTQEYNNYFGLHESEQMDILEFAKVDAQVTHAVLLEFMAVSLDEFELVNFLRAVLVRWTLINESLPGTSGSQEIHDLNQEEYPGTVTDDLGVKDGPVSTSFYRWRIGHQAFAIDAIYASFFFTCASQELEASKVPQAIIALQKAALSLRATTVSMLLASKIPKGIYNDYVRPSMGLGFSGSNNLWWNHLLQAMQTTVEKAKVLNSPGLTQALLDLHEKYLQDIELHTWVASKLVGSRPSLTLEEINSLGDETQRNERFATADLRSLHYLRQHEFEFLGYYPMLRQLFNTHP
ncbi:hypothetical protein GCM10028817_34170 [Spirosoma pomorum]